MINVTLPQKVTRKAPWMVGLIGSLGKLEEFGFARVKYGPTNILPNFQRSEQMTIVEVAGKRVLIDVWDFGNNMSAFLSMQNAPHVDLVLMIQRTREHSWPNDRGIKVLPWTMFHTEHATWLRYILTYRNRVRKTAKVYRSAFTGASRFHRRAPWVAALEHIEGVFLRTYEGSTANRVGTLDDYISMILEWGSGIILKGGCHRYTDGKNRREVEFGGLGIPMILNYRPHYYDDLTPDKHYIYAETVEDLPGCIERANGEEGKVCAYEAGQWWSRNAGNRGICESFMRIMHKEGIA